MAFVAIDDDFEYNNYDDDEDEVRSEKNVKPIVSKTGECCKHKCMLTFDDQFKSQLKYDLSLLSAAEKRIYLFALISINEKKMHGTKISKSSKYFEYSVKDYGISRPVCKTAFVELHDTTQAFIRTLCVKMTKRYLIPTDDRGKHENQLTIGDETKALIKDHFFRTLESPSIFQVSKKVLGQPNINQLWISFKEHSGHNLSRSTYSKYVQTFLTPEILSKFMCANAAKKIYAEVKKYEKLGKKYIVNL